VLLVTKRALPRGLLVLFRRVRHPHEDPTPKSVSSPAEPSRRRRSSCSPSPERRPSSISAAATSSSPTPHVQHRSKVRRPSSSLLLAFEMPCAVAGLASISAVRRRPWRLLSVTRAAPWSPWSGSPSPPLRVEPIRVAKGCPQLEINPAPASLWRSTAVRRRRRCLRRPMSYADRGGYRASSACYRLGSLWLGSLRLGSLWLIKIPS
jgi:hypothetical protein